LKNETILEVVHFKLKECIAEEGFISAYDAMENDFFRKVEGYIKRELVKTDNGEWIDTVYWRTIHHAYQGTEEAVLNPICVNCFKMMNEYSIKVSRMKLVRSHN
jgi:hypothetical protein